MMITRAPYLVFPGTTLSLSNIPNPGASLSFLRTSSFLSCRLSRHSILSDLLPQRLPVRCMFWMGGNLASDPRSQLSPDTLSLNDPQIHRPLQLQNWIHLLSKLPAVLMRAKSWWDKHSLGEKLIPSLSSKKPQNHTWFSLSFLIPHRQATAETNSASDPSPCTSSPLSL